MKKLTSLLLSLVLMVSVLACGASAKTSTKVRIAGLKGPTTMGLVNLLSMEKDGTASLDYDLQLYGAADEIVPKLIKGELDMAAIPANLAATLYQKTNGGIQVMAVNTLGVLYVVEKGNTVHNFADLKGRTILSTGKGTTPEYVLRYLLKKNGLDPDKDVKIEYYSEASEVTAQMAAARKDAIAVLPQPYVTAAQMKDSDLRVVLDLTREWNRVCDTQLITGVTVVRTEYAKQNPDVIAAFLTDYQKSVKAANEDIDGTAALCEEVGVVAKAAIAKKALPKCNIVYRNGQEMKKDISAYLQVLYDASPAAVGYAVAAVSWPEQVFRYPAPYANIPLWDASGVATSSTISDTLRSGGLINISALSLVLGEYAAPMGTGAAIVLVACGLFLWMQKDVRLSASLSFLITAGLIVFFFPRQLGLTEGTAFTAGLVFRLRCVRDEMLTGAMLFSAVFLLNEPYTCAHHRRGRILYGVMVGAFTMGFRYFGVYETGVCFAILAVNSISGWLDRTEVRLHELIKSGRYFKEKKTGKGDAE